MGKLTEAMHAALDGELNPIADSLEAIPQIVAPKESTPTETTPGRPAPAAPKRRGRPPGSKSKSRSGPPVPGSEAARAGRAARPAKVADQSTTLSGDDIDADFVEAAASIPFNVAG